MWLLSALAIAYATTALSLLSDQERNNQSIFVLPDWCPAAGNRGLEVDTTQVVDLEGCEAKCTELGEVCGFMFWDQKECRIFPDTVDVSEEWEPCFELGLGIGIKRNDYAFFQNCHKDADVLEEFLAPNPYLCIAECQADSECAGVYFDLMGNCGKLAAFSLTQEKCPDTVLAFKPDRVETSPTSNLTTTVEAVAATTTSPTTAPPLFPLKNLEKYGLYPGWCPFGDHGLLEIQRVNSVEECEAKCTAFGDKCGFLFWDEVECWLLSEEIDSSVDWEPCDLGIKIKGKAYSFTNRCPMKEFISNVTSQLNPQKCMAECRGETTCTGIAYANGDCVKFSAMNLQDKNCPNMVIAVKQAIVSRENATAGPLESNVTEANTSTVSQENKTTEAHEKTTTASEAVTTTAPVNTTTQKDPLSKDTVSTTIKTEIINSTTNQSAASGNDTKVLAETTEPTKSGPTTLTSHLLCLLPVLFLHLV